MTNHKIFSRKQSSELIFTLFQLQFIQGMRKLKRIADITQFGCSEPILESYMFPIDLKNTPKTLSEQIEALVNTAAHNSLVSLSANQILLKRRMFAVLRKPKMQVAKWSGYQKIVPEDYQVVINPVSIGQSSFKLKDFEQCPSIMGLRFHVWNPIFQKFKFFSPVITHQSIDFKQEQVELKGFAARVWDHQMRHLQGFLTLDRNISHGEISVSQAYQDIPAMYQLVDVLKQELQITSQKSLKKMFTPAKQNKENKETKTKNFENAQSIPQKIPKEMGARLSKQMLRVKKIMQKQAKDVQDDI